MPDERMQEERRFLAALEALKKDARRNGGELTSGQIRDAFSGEDMTPEKIRQIIAYLAAQGIRTDGAADDAGPPRTPDQKPAQTAERESAGAAEPQDEDAGDEGFLAEYERQVAEIEIPPENVLQAVKLSAMAGEKEAQRQLAEYMLAKVLDIAKLYAGQDVPAEDLISAGNEALMQGVGLLMALESPDEVEGDLGARIMRAMESAIAENLESAAAGQKIADRVNLVADKASQLAKDLGRRVTVEELANEGELTAEEILDAMRFSGGQIEDLEDPEKQS